MNQQLCAAWGGRPHKGPIVCTEASCSRGRPGKLGAGGLEGRWKDPCRPSPLSPSLPFPLLTEDADGCHFLPVTWALSCPLQPSPAQPHLEFPSSSLGWVAGCSSGYSIYPCSNEPNWTHSSWVSVGVLAGLLISCLLPSSATEGAGLETDSWYAQALGPLFIWNQRLGTTPWPSWTLRGPYLSSPGSH